MAHAYEEFDWYQTPLYYDMVFGTETKRQGDFLDAVYQRYVGRGQRCILEPACGSGRLVAEMARRGYDVTGFDISDGALAFANRRLARARARTLTRATRATRATRPLVTRIMHGRMESFAFQRRFDLAHCLVSTFKYLLTEDAARSHLECVANALRPGGVYVLGFHLSEYDQRSLSRERWIVDRRGLGVVCTIQSWPPDRRQRRERMRSRFVIHESGRTRRCETNWEFRTYSARQFRSLLAKVPALEHVDTYDFDYDAERPRVFGKERLDQVVILKKRP